MPEIMNVKICYAGLFQDSFKGSLHLTVIKRFSVIVKDMTSLHREL
jgi:hypothetical protein